MKLLNGIFILVLLLCIGCNINPSPKELTTTEQSTDFNYCSEIKFAKGFSIIPFKEYKLIIVFNPWNEKDTIATYLLKEKNGKPIKNLPKVDYVIDVPVANILPLSSTHIGFLAELNMLDKINCVSKKDLVYNPYLLQKIDKNQLPEVGEDGSINIELLLSITPQIIMKTSYGEEASVDAPLRETSIPLVYNMEWMEESILGRAEWIKFVGVFFNKNQLADSIFKNIEHRYKQISAITKTIRNKPSVMLGNNFKGVWHMPGGQNYLGKLVVEAGSSYLSSNNNYKGSIPLNFETVIEHYLECDFWIGPNAHSMNELLQQEERYKVFKPFKNKKVFSSLKRISKYGANDYYESGVVRPDIVLKDLVSIFHPDLFPDYEPYYWIQLK